MNNKLSVSASPHIRSSMTTQRIMLDVLIALLPAAVMGTVIFGWRALLVLSVCTLSAVLSEFVFNLIIRKEHTISDLSSAVTGLILGMNLHANAPIWQCVVGSVFAIVVVKCFFGGLGANFANPAATARVFLLLCFTGTLAGGAVPRLSSAPELVSGATPLEIIRNGGELPSLLDMFLGLQGGAIGETCTAALLVGFIYLVIRHVIYFETPIILVSTVFVLTLIIENSFYIALASVLSGGLVLAAVFMATDYVTSPVTRSGKMIFAFGCGLITVLIRFYGSYPEGVSFALLFMNVLTPYIEIWTRKKALGGNEA